MATKKTTTTKRSTTKKVAKPAATKKTATAATKPKAKATVKSNVRQSRTKDFMVVQFTRDTLYWLIFGVVTIVFVMWVMSLQHQINDLYDQIDASQMSSDLTKEKLRHYKAHGDKSAKD